MWNLPLTCTTNVKQREHYVRYSCSREDAGRGRQARHGKSRDRGRRSRGVRPRAAVPRAGRGGGPGAGQLGGGAGAGTKYRLYLGLDPYEHRILSFG